MLEINKKEASCEKKKSFGYFVSFKFQTDTCENVLLVGVEGVKIKKKDSGKYDTVFPHKQKFASLLL